MQFQITSDNMTLYVPPPYRDNIVPRPVIVAWKEKKKRGFGIRGGGGRLSSAIAKHFLFDVFVTFNA